MCLGAKNLGLNLVFRGQKPGFNFCVRCFGRVGGLRYGFKFGIEFCFLNLGLNLGLNWIFWVWSLIYVLIFGFELNLLGLNWISCSCLIWCGFFGFELNLLGLNWISCSCLIWCGSEVNFLFLFLGLWFFVFNFVFLNLDWCSCHSCSRYS